MKLNLKDLIPPTGMDTDHAGTAIGYLPAPGPSGGPDLTVPVLALFGLVIGLAVTLIVTNETHEDRLLDFARGRTSAELALRHDLEAARAHLHAVEGVAQARADRLKALEDRAATLEGRVATLSSDLTEHVVDPLPECLLAAGRRAKRKP